LAVPAVRKSVSPSGYNLNRPADKAYPVPPPVMVLPLKVTLVIAALQAGSSTNVISTPLSIVVGVEFKFGAVRPPFLTYHHSDFGRSTPYVRLSPHTAFHR